MEISIWLSFLILLEKKIKIFHILIMLFFEYVGSNIFKIVGNAAQNTILVMKNFWDMFVTYFIIGNTDRHNGNLWFSC